MLSPRTPIRFSPTSPQRRPRSRSSSPTRRVARSSPTSGGVRILDGNVPNGRPVTDSPVTPAAGSQGSQRGRPAHLTSFIRSPSRSCPGARVVDRKQCEREVSRIVVVTTELYDVRPSPLMFVLRLFDCHVAT